MRRVLIAVFCLLALSLTALPLAAAPQAYAIDRTTSNVSFTFGVLGTPTRASAPVSQGEFALDFEDISRSVIDVYVDASRARTAIPFVAQTMKSPEILDTEAFPEVRFTATDIRLNSPGDFTQGARVAGDLSIRGTTQPVVFQAALKRRAGSDPGDLSNLLVEVTGEIDRRAFGITAYEGTVGPTIAFEIDARLARR